MISPQPPSPRRIDVYLDQAKWVDLAQADHALPVGKRFKTALDVARHCVAQGLARFPLSNGHYIETWRIADDARRRRLASTMASLCRGAVMRKPPFLCDQELRALIVRVAQSEPLPEPPPVGWGFPYIEGHPSMSREGVAVEVEREHLSTRPPGYLAHGRGHLQFAEDFRDGEIGLAGLDREHLDQEQFEAVIAVSAVAAIQENIDRVLEQAGLPASTFGPLGLLRPETTDHAKVLGEAMMLARGFVAELPTRDAALRLRLLRHQNRQAKWEANDMVDIDCLAAAVVHCDIVVTEKQWVHELKRSGLLKQHGTVAAADVSQLPELLMARMQQ